MRAVLALSALGLAACGSAGADADMDAYRQQAINNTPVKNAVASSNTFFFCKAAASDAYDILCETCDVSVHDDVDTDGAITRVTAWATHYYHELKPWNEGEAPRISTTGERDYEKFVADAPDAKSARALFETANRWCQDRRAGDFLIRKDEIDTLFEGGPA